jgi:aminopeptidase N
MTLQALREKVGNKAFFHILRAWAAEHRYGNVTTAQFIALAERVSGRDLDRLFNVWLYRPEKPTSW